MEKEENLIKTAVLEKFMTSIRKKKNHLQTLQRTFSYDSAPELFCTIHSGKNPTHRSWAVNNFTASNKNCPKMKEIEKYRFIFLGNIPKVYIISEKMNLKESYSFCSFAFVFSIVFS